MGRDASGYTRLDPARILRICRVAGDMARECIYAAAEDMAYTDVSARRAKNLCNTAPAASRNYCWTGIGEILGSLNPEADETQGELRRGDEHEGATARPATAARRSRRPADSLAVAGDPVAIGRRPRSRCPGHS